MTDTMSAQAATPEDVSGPRQARLHLSRLDPWSVMKTAFVLSSDWRFVIIVAVVLVWGILAVLGVFSSVNDAIRSVAGPGSSVLDVESFFGWAGSFASLVLAHSTSCCSPRCRPCSRSCTTLTVPFTRESRSPSARSDRRP